MRLKNTIITGCLILIFSVGSFWLGNFLGSEKQEEIESYITQNTIAVVNADEGTEIDGIKVNYAAELMSFPNTNFISTGLADARDGVENGRYGAYIIIPENFSRAVTSINREPEKASVIYAVGDRLRPDIREKVIEDIRRFVTAISANMSYLYIDAIMGEFHTAQDGAKTVLKNDKKELEEVNTIEYEKLISEFLFPEVKRTELELETADLKEFYKSLDDNVGKIEIDYEVYIQEGKLAFDVLNQRGEIVDIAVLNFTDTMKNIDIEHRYEEHDDSVSQNTVYQKGLDHLLNYSDIYKDEFETVKNELGELITGEHSGNTNKKYKQNSSAIGLLEVEDSLSENSICFQEDIQSIFQENISVSYNSVRNEITVIRNSKPDKIMSPQEFTEQYIIVEKKKLDKVEADIGNLEKTSDLLECAKTNLMEKIKNIKPEISIERGVQRIISNEIIRPVKDNIKAEQKRLQNDAEEVSAQIYEYLKEMSEYDPLEYVDGEKIDETLLKIQENMWNLEDTIEDKNLEQFKFVSELYDVQEENFASLQTEVEEVNKKTVLNVEEIIEKTKRIRQENNEINSGLLDEFTQKLAYTRIGKLEKESVNKYIASPLEMTDKNVIQISKEETERGISYPAALGMAFSAAIILLIISSFFYLYIKKERRNSHETGL